MTGQYLPEVKRAKLFLLRQNLKRALRKVLLMKKR
jgi:hypothetical protein